MYFAYKGEHRILIFTVLFKKGLSAFMYIIAKFNAKGAGKEK